MGSYWLVEADKILELGGGLATSTLLDGLCTSGWINNLATHPSFQQAVRTLRGTPMHSNGSKSNIVVRIFWFGSIRGCTDGASPMGNFRQRADRQARGLCGGRGSAQGLARYPFDGGEETLQHPLAYSLYVHKHALIYLGEAARPPARRLDYGPVPVHHGHGISRILLSAAHLKVNLLKSLKP